MTKENWKTLLNTIATILSAIAAAICMNSCFNHYPIF